MVNAKTLLRDVFGFKKFRPGQREIIDAVACGENVLAIMPTGGGKSLCFQLPALLNDGLTVVISPLIALMRDQVRGLKAVGVAAGSITSGNTQEEVDQVFSQIFSGDSEDSGEIPEIPVKFYKICEISVRFQRFHPSK